MKRECYICDANTFIRCPDILSWPRFRGSAVIIPPSVLGELDRHKEDPGEVGLAVREVARHLDGLTYIAQQKPEKGGTRSVYLPDSDLWVIFTERESAQDYHLGYTDNRIIQTGLDLDGETTLVTSDRFLKIMGRINGLAALEGPGGRLKAFHKSPAPNPISEVWLEPISFHLSSELPRTKDRTVVLPGPLERWFKEKLPRCPGNAALRLLWRDAEGTEKDLYAILKEGVNLTLVSKPERQIARRGTGQKVKPINIEQAIALAYLMDPEISLVALPGTTGTGKTLMTLLAAYNQLRFANASTASHQRYGRIVVFIPTWERGKDMGFLPGDEADKMHRFVTPYVENLALIIQSDPNFIPKEDKSSSDEPMTPEEKRTKAARAEVQKLINQGRLVLTTINSCQGVTLPEDFVIVEEAQNFPVEDLRFLLPRVGMGGKLVVLGDPASQISHPELNAHTNGLAALIKSFQTPVAAQEKRAWALLPLRRVERSPLASFLVRLLEPQRLDK